MLQPTFCPAPEAVAPPRRGLRALTLALALAAFPLSGQAQMAGARVLTQDDYDLWRSIQGAELSPDGRWAAYTLTPQVGEGELVVRSTGSTTEYRVPRGYTGRPQLVAGASSRTGFVAPAARFTADSRYVVFTILPSQEEVERARRAKRRSAPAPRSALGILDLGDGSVDTVPRVKAFKLAKRSGRFVAYHLESAGEGAGADTAQQAPGGAAAVPGGQPRPISADSADKPAKRKEVGSRLVVRDLETGTEATFDEVSAFELDDSGRWLAFAVSSKTGERDGAFLHSLEDGRTTPLLTGPGNYRQLSFDEAGTQIALLSDRDSYPQDEPRYTLFHAALRSPTARPVVTADMLQGGWQVSEHGDVSFSKNGQTVLFGTAPAPLDSIPADSLADKAVFDLWHWRDLELQPQQRIRAAGERNRAFTTAFHLRSRRVVPLAGDSFPSVTVSDDGRTALALTSVPYAIEAMWGEGGSDVYVIDATTGERTRVAERVRFGAQLSPGARYVLYFHDGSWHAYSVATRRTTDLTGALDVSFEREDWSTPSLPAPWGVAGWTRGDRTVLLYDRFDVWEVDPSGRQAPRVLTASAGRSGGRVLRVVDLDREERFFDPAEPLLLSVFDEASKESGFAEARLGASEPPRQLVMAPVRFGRPSRAAEAGVYLVTRSTFQKFPDLWAGERLDALSRISDANPQQAQYGWGSVELVSWLSGDGVPLEGLLYRPANFDATKQYPMVVYFYETHSDNLHAYVPPAGRNIVNPTVYTSLGYLVFMPNIDYATGYPGPSALKSIVPGVQSLIQKGFVDPKGIGITGQSWGGYQTAYIVTQTNLFAAAVANAPVANMTSAYGGIRWGSGMARAFQYERTQSRIGGSLWEYPMRYLENSPLFAADRVQTPLLMMHNDNDGAVPWYQGIELFVALRRLGKEVYLINYNGDEHNPTKRANQKDIDLRMQQFFAHHLRGEPAPDWMVNGIPYLHKGRDQLARPVEATGSSH